jgi:hypothetical protein
MRIFVKSCFLLAILLTPSLAFADTVAPPRSYATPSPDNKFLFVMIASIEIELDGISYGEEGKLEAKRIRKTYPSSGMYLNNGSTKPLWTVDWHSNSVIVSTDGKHVVRRGPWASKMSDEAFTIFEQNKVVWSFKISELVASEYLLPHSVSHFMWEETMTLDVEKQALSVTTLSKERYVINYLNGEIIASERPTHAAVIFGVIILLALGFVLIKQKRLVK